MLPQLPWDKTYLIAIWLEVSSLTVLALLHRLLTIMAFRHSFMVIIIRTHFRCGCTDDLLLRFLRLLVLSLCLCKFLH